MARARPKKTPGVVSPEGPKGAAQKRHRESFPPHPESFSQSCPASGAPAAKLWRAPGRRPSRRRAGPLSAPPLERPWHPTATAPLAALAAPLRSRLRCAHGSDRTSCFPGPRTAGMALGSPAVGRAARDGSAGYDCRVGCDRRLMPRPRAGGGSVGRGGPGRVGHRGQLERPRPAPGVLEVGRRPDAWRSCAKHLGPKKGEGPTDVGPSRVYRLSACAVRIARKQPAF